MLTLKDKLQLLIANAMELKCRAEDAIDGKIEYVEVRKYYGQVRRILRAIESSLHNNAKKQRRAKGRTAMEQRDAIEKRKDA